ncbi:MAG: hypothetical protein R3345_03850 [Fulvivirga sp.]|nr:hypothetical protein [Fulvivirga sp.]
MKKLVLLFALSAFFISHKDVKAQHFIASFGSYHHWDVTSDIRYSIAHNYYGYDWVHANRIVRGGHVYFDVLLQRGDVFVEVNVGVNGRIYGRTFFDAYPLRNHVCSGHCGYHRTYYSTYRVACSSHHHHGHNHIVYRPTYRHEHRYDHRRNHPRGNAYGYYKNKKHHKHGNHVHDEKHYTRYDNDYPQRRGRYYDEEHPRRRSHHVSHRNNANERGNRGKKGKQRYHIDD